MPGFAVKAATVLGTTDGTDSKGKSVRMFAIKVETQGGGQWSTAKRYTEFKELEAEMELGGLEVEAKLPKKKLTHGKKTLEKRRLALQRWLDSAISHLRGPRAVETRNEKKGDAAGPRLPSMRAAKTVRAEKK